MPLKITWEDKNLDLDGFHIYRSESFIDLEALPAPLATVGGGVFEYTDDTIPMNIPYHYRIGAFKGSDENISPDRVLGNIPYTGPGPRVPLRGTWENGYFGRVSPDDLVSRDYLINFSGISAMAGSGNPNTLSWLKFSYKGKILFFPNMGIGYGITPGDLYQAGLFYGEESSDKWLSTFKTTYGIIPQKKILQKDEDAFIVRMPKSRAIFGSMGTVAPDDYRGNEIDLCFAGAFDNKNYGSLPDSPPIVDDIINENVYFFTMDNYDTLDSVNILVRGMLTFDAISSAITTDSVKRWRPVLELIM